MAPLLTVAVDVNPAESALLELKIAAIKHLSYSGGSRGGAWGAIAPPLG